MGTKIVYNHKAIEKKWRERWEETPVNPRLDDNGNKKQKYYCLDMFPYPSGNGLHVGHWRGYVISDVWSRYKLQQGYYIVHPMGWDAFGLPAENYAIKMGVHPAKSTAENVANIKKQINDIAALYDWDMEVNTTDPNFYKWTQWIFVKMFKAGLAYEKEFPINWCPSCKTGLANEEVVNGKCERCGAEVTKKNLRQWMLRITKYADRLLNDLDKLDWPEKVKKMQTDWIGKSYGAEVDFPVEGRDEKITVYTTRPDTLYGATFMVLAPEHELAQSLATPETKDAVEKYIYEASMKSNVDRMQDKEKTGVFTGSYAINPLNGAKTPIWLSDYVLDRSGHRKGRQRDRGHDRGIYRGSRNHDQFRRVEWDGIRSPQERSSSHHRGERHRPRDCELQTPRLGILPSALLGRADPDRTLPGLRRCARAGRGASASPAGCRVL